MRRRANQNFDRPKEAERQVKTMAKALVMYMAAHDPKDDVPMIPLGVMTTSKREALKELKNSRRTLPDAYLVRVTHERCGESAAKKGR